MLKGESPPRFTLLGTLNGSSRLPAIESHHLLLNVVIKGLVFLDWYLARPDFSPSQSPSSRRDGTDKKQNQGTHSEQQKRQVGSEVQSKILILRKVALVCLFLNTFYKANNA